MGLHLVVVRRDTFSERWHKPLVGLRSMTHTADPKLWVLFDSKHEICPVGPKFDTNSLGLKLRATGYALKETPCRAHFAPTADWA